MAQVSSYFATMGIEVDKRSFAEVDKYFDRLEQKLARIGKTSNAFAVNLKFNIDTARAKTTIQRDLNTISRGLTLRLNNFQINNKALRNLLNQSMNNRAGNARIRLNAALSATSLTNMRAQVLAALNNLVISPQINPRINQRAINNANAANPRSGGGGRSSTAQAGLFGLNGLPKAAAIGGGLYLAGRGFMKLAEATQMQASRDVAAKGLFQNATMPDGSTRDVYDNSNKWFRNYTNRVGLDRNELTPSYQGFMAASMPTLGYEKSQRVFEAFSSFGTVRGATGDSMKRGLVAVQQMASKGTVNAEELKQQLGDAQGFGEAQILFAQAWQMMKNKTNNPTDSRLLKGSKATAELQDAMKKNKLIASEILPIVSDLMLAKARPALEEASKTGTANQNRFNNAKTDFFANFAKGGGDAGMSNIWKALADLTQRAADNAEMLGANFRIATAYARVFMAELGELTDWLSGDAKEGNIFTKTFTPEMNEQVKMIKDNILGLFDAFTQLDLSGKTTGMKEFMQFSLNAVQALTAFAMQLVSIAKLDWQGMKFYGAQATGGLLGIVNQDWQKQWMTNNPAIMNGPGVPANNPAAASTAPLSNYGYTPPRGNTNTQVVVNNAVTITDKSQLSGVVDQLSQKALAENLSNGLQFVAPMDKAAFPNSGQ